MYSAKIFLFVIPAISAVEDSEAQSSFRAHLPERIRRRLAQCSEQQQQDYESVSQIITAAKREGADLPALAAQYAELKQANTEGCDLLRFRLSLIAFSRDPSTREVVEKLENYA